MVDELNEQQLSVLRFMVNLAKSQQIKNVQDLRAIAQENGHHESDITKALKYWAYHDAE